MPGEEVRRRYLDTDNLFVHLGIDNCNGLAIVYSHPDGI